MSGPHASRSLLPPLRARASSGTLIYGAANLVAKFKKWLAYRKIWRFQQKQLKSQRKLSRNHGKAKCQF